MYLKEVYSVESWANENASAGHALKFRGRTWYEIQIRISRRYRKEQRKKSRRQISLMSMTNHALGIRTCTHNSMTNPSYLHSEMHVQKFPDQTEFQSWTVNFRAEVCAKAKNLALVLQYTTDLTEVTSKLQSRLRSEMRTPRSRSCSAEPRNS